MTDASERRLTVALKPFFDYNEPGQGTAQAKLMVDQPDIYFALARWWASHGFRILQEMKSADEALNKK